MGLKKLLHTLGIGKRNSKTITVPNVNLSKVSNSCDLQIGAAMLSNINSTAHTHTGVIANSTPYYHSSTINAGTISQSAVQVTNSQYYSISGSQTQSTIAFHNSNNVEIVRLNKDGTVTWNKEIDIDAAAEAFCKSIQLGAERSAGITAGVKQRMRDTIFEEMIELAKIKGTLDADELTYMLQTAKIMDKLKGGYE